jgi:hypothetical protein
MTVISQGNGDKFIIKSFLIYTPHPLLWGPCSSDGGGERRVQGFGGERRGKEIHWGDPGVDERIILSWTFRKWDVVWTGLSWLGVDTGGGQL